MKTVKTPLEGLLIIKPRIFGDDRGYFLETHHQQKYRDCGIDYRFVQDNLSFSVKGTLRGLHFQKTKPQAKLIQALTGEIFDVAVDIRPASSTYGEWFGIRLSEKNRHQLFVPEGFAHGFCVLSESADFLYKCTDYYAPQCEHGIRWNDPDIGIDWPGGGFTISDKDAGNALLRDMAEKLPSYESPS